MALIDDGGYFLDIINQVNIRTEKTAHCFHLLWNTYMRSRYRMRMTQNWEIFEQFYSYQFSNFK